MYHSINTLYRDLSNSRRNIRKNRHSHITSNLPDPAMFQWWLGYMCLEWWCTDHLSMEELSPMAGSVVAHHQTAALEVHSSQLGRIGGGLLYFWW